MTGTGGALADRLVQGTVLGAEGYVFELERRGYVKAGAYVPEAVLDFPDAVTELHREFEPAAIRALKAQSPHDLAVSGAELAGVALRAGLVDELQLYVAPMLVGGGKALFPAGVRRPLTLTEERRFANGMVFLRHGVDNTDCDTA